MPNTYRRWFARVVWLGILGNWAFAAWVLFVDPVRLLTALNLGPVNSTVWLYNYSVLLAILSCFYIPAAKDPFRYRANAWLLIVGRLVPACTFFLGVLLRFMPPGFLALGIGDGTIGLLELFLLVRTFRTAPPG
jgi:hypothetical protein